MSARLESAKGGSGPSSHDDAPGGSAPPPPSGPTTTVGTLLDDARLLGLLERVHAAHDDARLLDNSRVQKNGLVLAGHFHGFVPSRVQVFGETELSYLAALSADERDAALQAFFATRPSCVVLSGRGRDAGGAEAWEALLLAAERTHTPLLVSAQRSSTTINAIHAVLDDLLAPTTRLHGVLVDVYGIGLLLRGSSGVGKSECALELVLRGHRLVADDVVLCDYRPPGTVFGASEPMLAHHMEIRGLGILNIRDLFGVTSVRARKRVDVVVRLVEWNDGDEYDRLGIDDAHEAILGVELRAITVPVRQGRDMGTILEIAARDELLRRAGIFSARRFLDQVHDVRMPRSAAPESTVGDLLARPGTGRARQGFLRRSEDDDA